MPCEKYRTGGGGTIILCKGRGAKRQPSCRCGYTATRACDWKLGREKFDGAILTCDKPLCPQCTYEPAEGKDLCPTHAAEWKARGVSVDGGKLDSRS